MRRLGMIWGTALLAGCASTPATVSFVSSELAQVRTFAMAPPAGSADQLLVPVVQRRLEALGFVLSPTPDVLVTAATADRSRAVGAFAPSSCASIAWVAEPRRPWLVGGGRVQTLTIRMTSSSSGVETFSSSASIRAASPGEQADIERLVDAALPSDPRRQPPSPARCAD